MRDKCKLLQSPGCQLYIVDPVSTLLSLITYDKCKLLQSPGCQLYIVDPFSTLLSIITYDKSKLLQSPGCLLYIVDLVGSLVVLTLLLTRFLNTAHRYYVKVKNFLKFFLLKKQK
jgi:hypothetical protein